MLWKLGSPHTQSSITVPKWCKDARSQWSIGQRGYTQLLSSIKFELHKMIRRNAETCREIYRWQVADASIWIRVVQLDSVNIEALCSYWKVVLTGQANCLKLTAKIIRCNAMQGCSNNKNDCMDHPNLHTICTQKKRDDRTSSARCRVVEISGVNT